MSATNPEPSVEAQRRAAIEAEKRRLRYVRTLVDLTASVLQQAALSRAEAEELVEAMRRQILRLFPGREETYEIVYRRRFDRLIGQIRRPAPRMR